jgi:phosphoglycolate phosphatase-like HAD superfamily hydrolase
MVGLVLFDIDGTLIRTGGAGVKAFARVFDRVFNARDGFEKLKFSGRTDYSLVREFFLVHQIPVTRENFEQFFDYYAFWLDQELHSNHCEICPGVLEFMEGLKRLRPAPIMGLLTGNIRLGAEMKLRHLQIWDHFHIGGFGDDHEDRNEIAAIARDRGSRLLGRRLDGKEIVVIGDTPLDIKCGRSISARVIAVATGGATMADLRPYQADWTVPDLRSLRVETL